MTRAGTGLPLSSVQLFLEGGGFLTDHYPGTTVIKGRADRVTLQQTPGRLLILTAGGGPGLTLEQAFDSRMITVRCVGQQRDYDDAEAMAGWVDKQLLHDRPFYMGGLYCLFAVRAGGSPTHIDTDASRRAHFQCSYVIPVESGL